MVYEFPELQGIMGREYALLEGEDPRVATAIYEHYLPTQAGGELPSDDIGAFVSLADKIDTICGCFSVGLIPTGTADPYALRRNAIGILAIILDRGYAISIPDLVAKSVELLEPKLQRTATDTIADVVEFIRLRLVNMLSARNYPADVIDAVLSASFAEPIDALKRIEALSKLKKKDDFEPLAVAFKRVGNIIKAGLEQPVDESLLTEDSEIKLFADLQEVQVKVKEYIVERDYDLALALIAGLRQPVDAFFDSVMVMVDDQAVKNNRLALLTSIAGLFKGIADFRRIA
jgi:glycyl-tRNA synthetase beta chain